MPEWWDRIVDFFDGDPDPAEDPAEEPVHPARIPDDRRWTPPWR